MWLRIVIAVSEHGSVEKCLVGMSEGKTMEKLGINRRILLE
jgi:hypothetical protein